MPKQQEWAVRVVQSHGDSDRLPGLWMEQFRRLGLLRVLKEWDGEAGGMECFELYGLGTKVWAEMNAERMCSFGINAVAAPRVRGGGE